MNRYLLGIDVGTTGTKSLLFSADGKLMGHAYRPYDMHTPRVGWSEQNAEDWWNAVVQTVREVCADPEIGRAVAGISLSVQGGTMVAVDKEYRPVRPAMVWNDSRCTEEKQAYLNEVGDANSMYLKTGWHLSSGMNAMQIRWMKDHEPELFQKTHMFLSVPDYISYKMTGKTAIDISNIGINQLGNIAKGCYDPQILAFAGISQEQLPEICHSGDVIGNLTAEAAAEMGLSTNAVLTAGAHDQYAVALGAGACKSGDILIGSGTCWAITCIGDESDFPSNLSQSVSAVPGKWGSLWSLSSGGVCLEWLRRNIALGTDDTQIDFGTINREAAQRNAARDGLYFFPFAGRCNLKKPFRKGSFIGLDLAHDRFHMARAIMEGVAFQIVWMLEAFKTKPSDDGLILAGGASRSPLWCQIVADIANLPVRISEVADLGCLGAAVLAGVGCGIYPDVEKGYKTLAVGEKVIYPNPENAKVYSELFEEYKRIAQSLSEAYKL